MVWLFFDFGSTLIDETDVTEKCIRSSLSQSAVPYDEFVEKMKAFAFRNKNAYKCTLDYYGLAKSKWDPSLEKIYPGVPELLKRLSEKFKLGIIANQLPGLDQRLDSYGIRSFFQIVISSSDFGKAKPEKSIFLAALEKADCNPEDAFMIGDRLDSDIIPAQKIGMKTVWVRQGFGGFGNPELLEKSPDFIINDISELETIFLQQE